MAIVIQPPQPIVLTENTTSVFLAGSIEMGHAEDWQTGLVTAWEALPVTILNPRRDDWDESWEQTIDHPEFRGQVEWELEGQERASLIVMYFAPETKAPITLLELGLFARTERVLVCCPPGFWRRGNVQVVCHRYGIPLFDDFDTLADTGRERLRRLLENAG